MEILELVCLKINVLTEKDEVWRALRLVYLIRFANSVGIQVKEYCLFGLEKVVNVSVLQKEKNNQ